MHHGGVQGYQVKDDSNESNSHMMPLPGSCYCNTASCVSIVMLATP
jgi:hypothetical protein